MMEVRARFQLIDATVSSFIFAPIVVLFWHGSFGVLDDIILRNSPYFGAWILIAIGIVIQVTASCFQESLHKLVDSYPKDKHKVFVLGYNFILGAAQILQFRGINDLYEFYIGVGVNDAISATVTSVVLLCALRLCSQTVDVPFVLGLDTDKPLTDTFKYSGYHGTDPGTHRDHVLDAFSTIGVMQSCVHLFAVASWVAVDSGLYKETPFLAMLASWFGGYSLLVVFWLFANIMQETSRGLVGEHGWHILARFLVDLMMVGEGLGVVMMWHGHWVFYDVIISAFPISIFGKNFTPYLEVIVAFCVMCACHISSSLVRSGMARDETDSCIDCIGINATYFSHFFNEDIKKQEAKGVENNNAVKENTNVEEVEKKITQRKKSKTESTLKQRKRVSLQELVDTDRQKRTSKKNK